MSLQDIFYVVGIVFLALSIFILLAIAIVLWEVRKTVRELRYNILHKVSEVIRLRGFGAIGLVGSILVPFVIGSIMKIFRRRL